MLCLNHISEGALLEVLDRALCILELSPDGAVIHANDNFLTVSGYALEDLLGKSHRDFSVTDPAATNAYGEFWGRLRRGEALSGTFCHQRLDGTLFWLEATYNPILDQDGGLTCVVQYGSEISDRIERQNEAEGKLGLLDRFHLMSVFAPNGMMLFANENFLNVFGFDERDLVGKSMRDLFSRSQLEDGGYHRIWDSIRTGHTFGGQVEMTSATGEAVWLDAIFSPIFNLGGKLVKVEQFAVDVTWRMREQVARDEQIDDLSLILDHAGAAVMATDRNNRVVYANAVFRDVYGYDPERFSRTGVLPTYVFGPDEGRILGQVRAGLKNGAGVAGEEMAVAANGQRRWVSFAANPVFDADAGHRLTVHTLADITVTKVRETLQRAMLNALASEGTPREILNKVCIEVERLAPEVIVLLEGVDHGGRLYPLAAPSIPDMFWNNPSQAVNDNAASVRAVATGDSVIMLDMEENPFWVLARREFVQLGVHACGATPVVSARGAPVGVVTFFYQHGRDPDLFHQTLARILGRLCAVVFEADQKRLGRRHIDYFDQVTSLPNRDLFLAMTERALVSHRERDAENPLGFLAIHVDDFGRMTETYGYGNGNSLMDTIAKRIAARRRGTDLLGRLNEDTFALVVPGCDVEQTADIANRMQLALSIPFQMTNGEATAAVRIGVAMYPESGTDTATLMENALAAMDRAKKDPASNYRFYSPVANERARKGVSLKAAFRRAVREDGLTLYYQPQIRHDGVLHGVEALARWRDEEFGSVPPAKFIPLAEKSGLIEEMSDWVVRSACAQFRLWREKGMPIPAMGVNLSAASFRDRDFPHHLCRRLAEQGMTPADLVLEITEQALVDADPAIGETVAGAHAMGFHIAWDGFGAGSSSLCHLRDLPISTIKLDQAFVGDLADNAAKRRLCQAIRHLAEDLDLLVVVEGVENREQFDLLVEQGYHILQGYYICYPQCATDFEKWFTGRDSRILQRVCTMA